MFPKASSMLTQPSQAGSTGPEPSCGIGESVQEREGEHWERERERTKKARMARWLGFFQVEQACVVFPQDLGKEKSTKKVVERWLGTSFKKQARLFPLCGNGNDMSQLLK